MGECRIGIILNPKTNFINTKYYKTVEIECHKALLPSYKKKLKVKVATKRYSFFTLANVTAISIS